MGSGRVVLPDMCALAPVRISKHGDGLRLAALATPGAYFADGVHDEVLLGTC